MRSPIPIAVFFSSFEPGAATRPLIELVRHLDRERFDVYLACVERQGRWLEAAEAAGAPVTEFPVGDFHHPSTVTEARRFTRWCRERGIQVVHAAGFRAEVFALPAAAFASVPVRVATRAQRVPDAGAARAALRLAAYACARRIVASSAEAAAQLAAERVPERKVQVIAEGIDASAFRVSRPERPMRRVAVAAGGAADRALDVIVEAAALAARRIKDLEIVVDARSPGREHLRAVASRLGVAARFTFDDRSTATRLESADLLVQPGGLHGGARRVLEAMAAGLPIVVPRGDEAASLIKHQRTGVVVAPDDPRALAWAWLDLLQWPSHARALGTAAQAYVERHHRLDAMISAFQHLYLDALQAPHPALAAGPRAAAS